LVAARASRDANYVLFPAVTTALLMLFDVGPMSVVGFGMLGALLATQLLRLLPTRRSVARNFIRSGPMLLAFPLHGRALRPTDRALDPWEVI
jgi:hypothetical protein